MNEGIHYVVPVYFLEQISLNPVKRFHIVTLDQGYLLTPFLSMGRFVYIFRLKLMKILNKTACKKILWHLFKLNDKNVINSTHTRTYMVHE